MSEYEEAQLAFEREDYLLLVSQFRHWTAVTRPDGRCCRSTFGPDRVPHCCWQIMQGAPLEFTEREKTLLGWKLNPERFAQLYERMAKQYDSDVLQALMGFTSSDAFEKVYKEARDALPEALQKALDKQKDEIKTIDGLAAVLNGLFREFGETLPSDFMTFAWGSKDILWTMVRRRKTWDTITAAAREADQRGLSFAEVVATALTSHQEQENHDG